LAQIFPKWTNTVPTIFAHLLAPLPLVAAAAIWYYGSPEFTDVGYRPEQPVPFSHKLHAGELGLDCRYCHATVEESQEANIPPTQTCMNCHKHVKTDSEKLAPVRESFETGKPIEWLRVHKLPEYAFFDHSIHLRAGVGCASCHGRVDQMEVVEQDQALSMGWCLECHRNPSAHIRDLSKASLTDMAWAPSRDQFADAQRMIEEKDLNPPPDGAACHR
jgi:hypothetical protein